MSERRNEIRNDIEETKVPADNASESAYKTPEDIAMAV